MEKRKLAKIPREEASDEMVRFAERAAGTHTALAIGKRVGHSAEKITYRYAHLFPSVQQDMAEQLDAENMDEELNEVEGGLANVG